MTTREGGVSLPPWDSMNLGDHVGDAPVAVQTNRHRLAERMLSTPIFLQQVHQSRVLQLRPDCAQGQVADACWTASQSVVCTIMVADCLPVLLCDASGQWVAAAHAGWRGLAGAGGVGVLESLLSQLPLPNGDFSGVMAWLGPCIGPMAFEVGPEVRAALCAGSDDMGQCFVATSNGKFLADLAGLARQRLYELGIRQIYGNDSQLDWCTASQASVFFSHRRDTRVWGSSGRMAACIWLAP